MRKKDLVFLETTFNYAWCEHCFELHNGLIITNGLLPNKSPIRLFMKISFLSNLIWAVWGCMVAFYQ